MNILEALPHTASVPSAWFCLASGNRVGGLGPPPGTDRAVKSHTLWVALSRHQALGVRPEHLAFFHARHLAGHSSQSVTAQGCAETCGFHPAATAEISITQEQVPCPATVSAEAPRYRFIQSSREQGTPTTPGADMGGQGAGGLLGCLETLPPKFPVLELPRLFFPSPWGAQETHPPARQQLGPLVYPCTRLGAERSLSPPLPC